MEVTPYWTWSCSGLAMHSLIILANTRMFSTIVLILPCRSSVGKISSLNSVYEKTKKKLNETPKQHFLSMPTYHNLVNDQSSFSSKDVNGLVADRRRIATFDMLLFAIDTFHFWHRSGQTAVW